jgi:CspA family cold shock protein
MDGIVKSWNDEEGFGWITVKGGDDVWVHYSSIIYDPVRFPTGYRFLERGWRVTFDLEEHPEIRDEQRRRAVSVKVVSDSQ